MSASHTLDVEALREQQRAIGDVLRALARGEGLQAVLDEVVEAASRLCGGAPCRLWLVRGDLLHAFANSDSAYEETFEYDKQHPDRIQPGTLTGRTALTRAPVQIPDIEADPEYTYSGPRPFRAGLSVPILHEEELIGVMSLVRPEPGAFSDAEIELVQTFADQAAIAIANARLVDAVNRQLEQQRAVSEAQRALARGEALERALDDVVKEATRLCEGDYGGLWLVEGGVLLALSHQGAFEQAEYDRQHPHAIDRTTLVGRAAAMRDVVQIPDVLADAEYAYPGPRTGYRAGLGVPILFEDDLIGAIAVVRAEPGPFSDAQIELVKTFADQAAMAVANARLLDAVERQLEQQRAIGDVLRTIALSHGREEVFREVVEAAIRLTRADFGGVYLRDGDVFRPSRYAQWDPAVEDFEHRHPHVADRRTAIGRVALTQDVVHIPDVEEDPEYDWGGRDLVDYRAVLAAPILVDHELVGVVDVARRTPGPFGEDSVRLIRTFADQAGIAIATARLLDTVEDQLEQQRAVSDALRALARGEGLQPVLDEVVNEATRLCEADYGALWLAQGGALHALSHQGTADQAEYDRQHPTPFDRTTLVGRAAVIRDVVHIPDVLADAEYAYPGPRAGLRAGLGVPILFEDELIGAMAVVRAEPGPFADDQIELFKTFADHAAIAIANARLLDALERQLEQQRAIGDILRAIALSRGLEDVFQEVVEAAIRLARADFGGVYLREGDVFCPSRHAQWDPVLEDFERRHPHSADRKTAIGRVALTRDVVHIPDVEEDPEYDWGGRDLVDYHAVLAAPILVEHELVGVLDVTRRTPGPFGDDTVRLIRTLADQAGIAVANARLLTAVERQRTELSRFLSPQVAELVSSEEGERLLAGHRAYVSCLFCDLRGFTAFAETAAPEELLELLREYHAAMGRLIGDYGGTLEHFAGDGMVVFFNDPAPVEDHEMKAIRFALAAQERFRDLASAWRKRGIELGLGIGIAAGYATLGRFGFEARYEYGVVGPVPNLASRLTDAAAPGEVLISQRVYAAVEDRVQAEPAGEFELKGFGRPVEAYVLRGLA